MLRMMRFISLLAAGLALFQVIGYLMRIYSTFYLWWVLLTALVMLACIVLWQLPGNKVYIQLFAFVWLGGFVLSVI